MLKGLLFLLLFICHSFFLYSDEANDYFKNGIIHVQNNQSKEAIEAFQNAIKLNPNHAEAHCMLGIEIYKKAVPQKSEEILRQAITHLEHSIGLDPNLGIAHDVIGFAYYILGEFETSRMHHRKAIKLGIKNPVLARKLDIAFKMIEKKNDIKSENPP